MQGQNQSIDKEVAVSIRDDFFQKLDALLKVMTARSRHVVANEKRERQGKASSTSSPPTSVPRWRVGCQGTPDPHPDVAEDVHRHMAERMKQATVYTGATTEGDMMSDEEEQTGSYMKETSEVRIAQDWVYRSPQQGDMAS